MAPGATGHPHPTRGRAQRLVFSSVGDVGLDVHDVRVNAEDRGRADTGEHGPRVGHAASGMYPKHRRAVRITAGGSAAAEARGHPVPLGVLLQDIQDVDVAPPGDVVAPKSPVPRGGTGCAGRWTTGSPGSPLDRRRGARTGLPRNDRTRGDAEGPSGPKHGARPWWPGSDRSAPSSPGMTLHASDTATQTARPGPGGLDLVAYRFITAAFQTSLLTATFPLLLNYRRTNRSSLAMIVTAKPAGAPPRLWR